MPAIDPRSMGGEDLPPWFAAVAEFLDAWASIERYGVEGWMSLAGLRSEDLDPLLADTLRAFNGELERLRHEAECEEARKARRVEGGRARG